MSFSNNNKKFNGRAKKKLDRTRAFKSKGKDFKSKTRSFSSKRDGKHRTSTNQALPLKFSQNFIRSDELVEKILKKANLPKSTTVIDIGAGKGKITQVLVKQGYNVIALEKDPNLVAVLHSRFDNTVKIVNQDVYKFTFPSTDFAVFANIPFFSTADIVKMLTSLKIKPQQILLFMQREAAYKFLGSPFAPETFQSLVLKMDWQGDIIQRCHREDFFPKPAVSVVVVQWKPKTNSPITKELIPPYLDLIAYAFGGWWNTAQEFLIEFLSDSELESFAAKYSISEKATITAITYAAWEDLLLHIWSTKRKSLGKTVGSYRKLVLQQLNLQKQHRTRAY